VSRFQFVADHRNTFELKRMCEVIEVNRSSFNAWNAAAPARAERAADDEQLAERTRVVHETDRAYGAPRGVNVGLLLPAAQADPRCGPSSIRLE